MNVPILSARRARRAAAGVAAAACAMALAPVGAQAAVDCGAAADQLPTANRTYLAEAATRCLINNERQAQGLAPLVQYKSLRGSRFVNVLSRGAYKHNQDMVTNHFRSHTGSDGSTRASRLAAYPGRTGEILYSWEGSGGTPRAAVRAWMASRDGHREQILDPGYRQFGAAASHLATTGKPGGTYTVTFGS
jgi:uncharacterized protein YkwD